MESCAIVSFMQEDPTDALIAILVSAAVTLLSGLVLWYFTQGPMHLSRKDGFGVVTFSWLAVAHFGALPYLLTGDLAHPITAIFETMSGFTTTGASALDDVDSLQKGILFWRSMTQWLGGMGVVILCVAILPFLGVGGMRKYRGRRKTGSHRASPQPRSCFGAVYIVLSGLEIRLLKGMRHELVRCRLPRICGHVDRRIFNPRRQCRRISRYGGG